MESVSQNKVGNIMEFIKNQKDLDKKVNEKFSGTLTISSETYMSIEIGGKAGHLYPSSIVFMKQGLIHNEKGPAIKYKSPWKEYHWFIENGNFVNEKGKPSFLGIVDGEVVQTHYYDFQGRLHCEFGFAKIDVEKRECDYFLDGKKMSEKSYEKMITKIELKKKVMKL